MIRSGIPAILLAGMLFSCTNDLDSVAAIEVPAAAPDRITFGAEYQFTDSGRVQNRLKAARIEEYRTEPARTELLGGLELTFYDSLGDPGSILTARRGTIIPSEERMEVFEEVVFVNERGDRLETEQLTWVQDSGKVRTDKAVRIQRGGDIIHGHGLDADQDMKKYRIHKITGELFIAEDDTLAP
ncbi:MAG: LPS export ABC transporter periplasmic protein LptC [Bacteroidota bacterium]|nr:LPS export ABC transporter periplasmic protein LptC [Bacteroidota bacterium]